jgi:hypothetical protein
MDSFPHVFTPEQAEFLKALLGPTGPDRTSQPIQLVDADYTSDSETESDSGCEEPRVKRHRGRPKKVRTPEELAARAASKARGRGRPKVERTPEQLIAIADAVAAKEARKKDREAKKLEREASDAMRHQMRQERQAKTLQKAIEKADRAEHIHAKRTEIYQKMLAAADAYKAKWEL